MPTLVDCFNCAVGEQQIARGVSFQRQYRFERLTSQSEAGPGDHSDDKGACDISCRIEAQDPLILPTILALTYPQLVGASGKVKGGTTYNRWRVLHAMLNEFSLSIEDGRPGTCSFGFRNRATRGTAYTVANRKIEMPNAVTAVGPIVPTLPTTIRILSGSFTPLGGGATSLDGITRLTLSGRARESGEVSWPGAEFVDDLHYDAWEITGTVDFKDKTLTNGELVADYLGSLLRGTLTVVCKPTGSSEGAVTNRTITIGQMDFSEGADNLRTKDDAEGPLSFGVLLKSGDTYLSPAEVIGVA